jgi:lysophospholipase L1-like esterase
MANAAIKPSISIDRILFMKTIIRSIALVFIGAIASATADDSAFAKWGKDISAIEAKIQSGESQQGSILFVGSSSIRLWKLKESFPERVTSNHGFGGSQMADSVHFFERIVTPVKPSVIVIYAGDNDIAQEKSPQVVAEDFAQFAAKVKEQLPECRKVIFVAIKPSVKRWALADTIKTTNQLIRTNCEKDERLHFLDIWTPMLDANGQPRPELLLEDGLHMNADGYKIWNNALEAIL